MRIVLDTNRYTDLARREPTITSIVATASEIHLPFVVLGELAVGFQRGNRRAANESELERFQRNAVVRGLYPDSVTSQTYADLYSQLAAKGGLIPTNDIWIAALALQHRLTLCTRDAHFDRLPQLLRL